MTRTLAIALLLALGCTPGQLTSNETQGAGGSGGSGGSDPLGSGGTGGSGGGDLPDANMAIDAEPDAEEMPDADIRPCMGGAASANDLVTGHCFMFYATQLPYNTAALACQSLGYHLATITTPSEQATVQMLNGVNATWIGYSDSQTEGMFKWITGEVSTYTHWAPGEPNNGGGRTPENCTILDPNRQDQWDDRVCANQYDYICERD